jgi:hypothetical protein
MQSPTPFDSMASVFEKPCVKNSIQVLLLTNLKNILVYLMKLN